MFIFELCGVGYGSRRFISVNTACVSSSSTLDVKFNFCLYLNVTGVYSRVIFIFPFRKVLSLAWENSRVDGPYLNTVFLCI